MSIKIELRGTVYQVGSPTESKGGFISQEMILHVPNPEFPDHFRIEWNQKGIENLRSKNIQDNDLVDITAYLSGKKYQKATEDFERAFNPFKGFKVDKVVQETEVSEDLTPFPELDKVEAIEVKPDLPF
tara:strand:- start:279 stop:665 length:387 start_codon:yes stop_codon:yes gene_type:complete